MYPKDLRVRKSVDLKYLLDNADTTTFSSDEITLFEKFNPSILDMEFGKKQARNPAFALSVGFNIWRNIVAVDAACNNLQLQGEDVQETLVKRAQKVNLYLSPLGLSIDERKERVALLHDIVTTSYKGIQRIIDNYSFDIQEIDIPKSKEFPKLVKAIYKGALDRYLFTNVLVHGSWVDFQKGKIQRTPSDIDMRGFISGLTVETYNSLFSFHHTYDETKKHQRIRSYHFDPEQTYEGIPLGINVVPAKHLNIVSLFDKQMHAKSSFLLQGETIRKFSEQAQKGMYLCEGLSGLAKQRAYVTKTDEEFAEDMQIQPRKIMSAYRVGEEMYRVLPFFEGKSPLSISRKDFGSKHEPRIVRAHIAQASIETSEMLQRFAREHF